MYWLVKLCWPITPLLTSTFHSPLVKARAHPWSFTGALPTDQLATNCAWSSNFASNRQDFAQIALLHLYRREELREAVTSSVRAQELLHKYSVEALGESLLAYVTKARAALGPPLLKV